MKSKLTAILLAAALTAALTLPVSAKTAYTYQPFTITDKFGDVYTFSAASVGYELHSIKDGTQQRNPLIILKPGSTVTCTVGTTSNYSMGFDVWAISKDHDRGYNVGLEYGKFGTFAVERIFDLRDFFGSELEDSLASLMMNDGNTFFMLETAAQRHSEMVTLKGAPAPKFAPKPDISITFADAGDEVDNGYIYLYEMKNNTPAPIQKYAAVVTYLPALEKETEYDFSQKKYVEVENGRQLFRGQIHAVDIDLAAGASVKNPIISNYYYLSTYDVLWIEFDSLAERDAFLKDSVFGMVSVDSLQGYRAIDEITGDEWMQNVLGVTIAPAT